MACKDRNIYYILHTILCIYVYTVYISFTGHVSDLVQHIIYPIWLLISITQSLFLNTVQKDAAMYFLLLLFLIFHFRLENSQLTML